MPKIAYIANLWTLVNHPSATRQWSLERKIRAVAAAGFNGIMTKLTPEHRQLAEKAGLQHLIGFISTDNPSEFAALIQQQKDAGARHLNIHLDNHDTPPALAVRHWRQMERVAEKIGGVVPSLEVHRDTCTETPEKTYEIAERYHRATGQLLKLTFDFSHLSVVKHLAPSNFAERLLTHPDLLQNSEQCHFRPFNGHHCQIAVTHRGQLTPEVGDYLGFAQAVMTLWKKAPQNTNRTLFACPEMGPMLGYNITGLPPSWPEAIRLRRELVRVWKKA